MVVVVESLASRPELIPIAAEWHFREWGHTDPGSSVEAWTAAMTRQVSHVPGMLIALTDGSPAGVVGMVAHDMPGYGPAAGMTPWVKGLCVAPAMRRRGVGTILMRKCEAMAVSLGHRFLYLYTERGSPALSLYERLDWHTIYTGRYSGIDVEVMRIRTQPERSAQLGAEITTGWERPS